MKLLLLEAIEGTREKVETRYPPLSLAYLASYVRSRSDVDVEVATVSADETSSVLGQVEPDVVGIGAVTQNFDAAVTVAHRVKAWRSIPVIVGGHHVTALPESLDESMDVAVLGEGEGTLLELLELYREDGCDSIALGNVAGIAFRRNGELVKNRQRPPIRNLDDLPMPARDLLKMGTRDAHILTSRGCPFKCAFCSSSHFWGNVRYHSAERVVAEIDQLVESFSATHINIYDDLFATNRKRLARIVELLEKRDFIQEKRVRFSCLARADVLNNALVELLKRMNVTAIAMGLESGSDRILKMLKGNSSSVAANEKAVRLIQEAGMRSGGSVIIGSPTESHQDAWATLDLIERLSLDSGDAYLAVPYPGTKLWDHAQKENLVEANMPWRKFRLDPRETPIMLTDRIPPATVLSFLREARRRLGVRDVVGRKGGRARRRRGISRALHKLGPLLTRLAAPVRGFAQTFIGKCRGFFPDRDPLRRRLTLEEAKNILACCRARPLVSIIVPVYKTPLAWLDVCVRSVLDQQYGNWELVLVDDGSDSAVLSSRLAEWSNKDERIRVSCLEENSGIAAATNAGIEMARGDFVGFLDHDDELSPDALTWIVRVLNEHPDALWLYSDEDKISEDGICSHPFLKPDYSPELLLSSMFTCHFSLYADSVLRELGGLREGLEGSQDHDLALRASEIVDRSQVFHIPQVLYHWRSIPGSTADHADAKPYAAVSGRKAVAEALRRRNLEGEVASHRRWPTVYTVTLKPKTHPKVTVVIPARDDRSMLDRCIDSLRIHTEYPNYDIVVIDNGPGEPDAEEPCSRGASPFGPRVVKYEGTFNHSDMSNRAVQSVDSEYFVLADDDIEVVSDGWLEQMVATAEMDETIAGVGSLLLHPDNSVQRAGIILGFHGLVGRSSRDTRKDKRGHFARPYCIQEMSAVSSELALLRRSAFLDVGGFNAERYPSGLNDVDLWLRLRKQGFRCIHNPMVRAIHHESATRRRRPDEVSSRRALEADWSESLRYDPFYNPHLPLDDRRCPDRED